MSEEEKIPLDVFNDMAHEEVVWDVTEFLDPENALPTKAISERAGRSTNSTRTRLKKAYEKGQVLRKTFKGKYFWAPNPNYVAPEAEAVAEDEDIF